ncbi:hypothetical protein ACWF9B_00970 [Streptomyces sp. NPDC055089]
MKRKGTGDVQLLTASIDSFVWLRIYQHEIWAKGAPRGRDEPLWWTLRRPWRTWTRLAPALGTRSVQRCQ